MANAKHDAKNAIACLQSCLDLLGEQGKSDQSLLELMQEACDELLALVVRIP
jgi:hypothetical protein